MFALCPICTFEYESGETECAFCGCKLVPGSIEVATLADNSANDNEASSGKGDEFFELCRPGTFPIAMLVKQMLEQNGVDVIVKGAHSMSVLPQLAFCGELRVFVRACQVEFARQLYTAYFEGDGGADYIEDEEEDDEK